MMDTWAPPPFWIKRVRIVKDLPYDRTKIDLDEFLFDSDVEVKELPNWMLKLLKPKHKVEGSRIITGKVIDVKKKYSTSSGGKKEEYIVLDLENPEGRQTVRLEVIRINDDDYLLEDWILDHADELIEKWIDLEFKDEIVINIEVLGYISAKRKLICLYIHDDRTHDALQKLREKLG